MGKPTPSVEKIQRSTRGSRRSAPALAPPAGSTTWGVTTAAVGLDRGADRRVVLGRQPAPVDLRVVGQVAAPGLLAVGRDRHVDPQPGRARRAHGVERLDVAHGLLRRLADREPAVEAEREPLGHGAVARRVEPRPGGRARAVAEERVVEEALARVVAPRGLGHDRAAVLERVQALPRHRAVAGAAGDHDLDLHPPALAAVDAERALLRVAGALGEDRRRRARARAARRAGRGPSGAAGRRRRCPPRRRWRTSGR